VGVGFDLTSQRPRCFKMALMTSWSSMNARIRMIPPHPLTGSGQASGRSGDRPSPIKSGTGSDFLNEPGQVLPVFLGAFIRFQDGGDPVVLGFFSPSPGDITVVPIVQSTGASNGIRCGPGIVRWGAECKRRSDWGTGAYTCRRSR